MPWRASGADGSPSRQRFFFERPLAGRELPRASSAAVAFLPRARGLALLGLARLEAFRVLASRERAAALLVGVFFAGRAAFAAGEASAAGERVSGPMVRPCALSAIS